MQEKASGWRCSCKYDLYFKSSRSTKKQKSQADDETDERRYSSKRKTLFSKKGKVLRIFGKRMGMGTYWVQDTECSRYWMPFIKDTNMNVFACLPRWKTKLLIIIFSLHSSLSLIGINLSARLTGDKCMTAMRRSLRDGETLVAQFYNRHYLYVDVMMKIEMSDWLRMRLN